jgi:hypothetical protein
LCFDCVNDGFSQISLVICWYMCILMLVLHMNMYLCTMGVEVNNVVVGSLRNLNSKKLEITNFFFSFPFVFVFALAFVSNVRLLFSVVGEDVRITHPYLFVYSFVSLVLGAHPH